jgi:hypothetical protein
MAEQLSVSEISGHQISEPWKKFLSFKKRHKTFPDCNAENHQSLKLGIIEAKHFDQSNLPTNNSVHPPKTNKRKLENMGNCTALACVSNDNRQKM